MKASELVKNLNKSIEKNGDFHVDVPESLHVHRSINDFAPYPAAEVIVVAGGGLDGEKKCIIDFPKTKTWIALTLNDQELQILLNYIEVENGR